MIKPVPWCHQGCAAVRQPLPHLRHHRDIVISPVCRFLARDAWRAASDSVACLVAVVSQISVHRCSSAAAETASSPASPSTPVELFKSQSSVASHHLTIRPPAPRPDQLGSTWSPDITKRLTIR